MLNTSNSTTWLRRWSIVLTRVSFWRGISFHSSQIYSPKFTISTHTLSTHSLFSWQSKNTIQNLQTCFKCSTRISNKDFPGNDSIRLNLYFFKLKFKLWLIIFRKSYRKFKQNSNKLLNCSSDLKTIQTIIGKFSYPICLEFWKCMIKLCQMLE